MSTTKRKDYNEKRNHIIQTANTLFLEKGYEVTSVDHILEKAGISKGTFYHYFSHKLELLEAIVDNFTLSYVEPLDTIVSNREMNAVEKLNACFELNQILKKENQAILIQVIAIWFKEENLIYKERLYSSIKKVLMPSLTRILKQGLEEGSFNITDAGEAAALIVQLIAGSRDRFIEEIMKTEPDLITIKNVVKTYQQCLERTLAVPAGSLKIFSPGYFEGYSGAE